ARHPAAAERLATELGHTHRQFGDLLARSVPEERATMLTSVVASVEEKRTKFYNSLQKATKAFEELTFDDAQDFYEDDMVQQLEELQQAIGSCLAALRSRDS
ncbi:hypothetical protein ABZ372_54985, partial [Streptomyces sp. NPDC005921]